MYVSASSWPYPAYTDPTRRLYSELGMVRTLALGKKPDYAKGKSLLRISLESIAQGLGHLRTGLAVRGGDHKQVGGEFLFQGEEGKGEEEEEKRVTWCHRMRTTRDHTESDVLRELLGIDAVGEKTNGEGKREDAGQGVAEEESSPQNGGSGITAPGVTA